MDTRYTGDILKHLEKQNELLSEAQKSITHELQKLQVEEEMLMRKYYEIMVAQGLVGKVEKKGEGNSSDNGENGHLLLTTTSDGTQTR